MALLEKRTLIIIGAFILIGIALFLLFDTLRPKTPAWVTTTVERGDVTEIVSVSGYVEAKNTAELAFPSVGVVTKVYAYEGAIVTQGDILATQASTQLVAQRNEARAVLNGAIASYDELISGADDATRSIAYTNLKNAEQELARVTNTQDALVANARRELLSSGLTARSTDLNERATAPTITGTYRCEDEGSYTLELYSSNALSGYSYRLSGIETGTSPVATQQPSPLGTCGLFIQFAEGDLYSGSQWIIDIPNKESAQYVSNANAYTLAVNTRDTAIATAEDALALAQEETARVLADPRNEAVRTAQAEIDQAQARIDQIDAQIADRSIIAPFDGVVTDVHILTGETAGSASVVTLLATDAFELTVRVPEIDIVKLAVGQPAEAVFDANPTEVQIGSIAYISPLATLIDGVAYFEAAIELTTMPTWIRSGLNADVDIIIDKEEATLRIPKRFLTKESDGLYTVRTPNGTKTSTTTVDLLFEGNDGFVAITGLNEGDTIVAP